VPTAQSDYFNGLDDTIRKHNKIDRQVTPHFIDREDVRKREIRVNQALSILKSTNFYLVSKPSGSFTGQIANFRVRLGCF